MKEKKVSGFLHRQWVELAYHAGRGILLTKGAEGRLLAEEGFSFRDNALLDCSLKLLLVSTQKRCLKLISG